MASTTPPQIAPEEQQERANQLSSEQQRLDEPSDSRRDRSIARANTRADALNDMTSLAGTGLSLLNSRQIRTIEKDLKKKAAALKKTAHTIGTMKRSLWRKKIRIFFEGLSVVGILAAVGELVTIEIKSAELSAEQRTEKKLIQEIKTLTTKKYNLENLFKRQNTPEA